MKNKPLKLIVVTLFVFLLCGCWNYNELNTLAIATEIGIDKKDDEYKVNITISNSTNAQSSSKEGQSQITVLEGKGKTITEAIDKIDLKMPKKLYLNHLNSIIISEEVAKEGIMNMADLLLREPESRKRFYLLIAKDSDAKDVLKTLTALDSRPSQSIAATIQTSSNTQAMVTTTTYSNFINVIVQKGIQPTLNSISVQGNEKKGDSYESLQKATPEANIKLGPLAIFKKDKFLGFSSEEESKGINLILNRVKNFNVSTKCDENYIVGNIGNVLTQIKTNLKGNNPSIDIKVTGEGSILETNCDINLMSDKVIHEIEEKFEKEAKKIIQKGLKVAQKEYKSDVLGFGQLYYHYYPNYYKKVSKIWDEEIFPDIKVNIKVDFNIKTKGSLEQSIRKEER